jgi:hypothetical protein
LGGCPAAGITVGAARTLAMIKTYMQILISAIEFMRRDLTCCSSLDHAAGVAGGLIRTRSYWTPVSWRPELILSNRGKSKSSDKL